MSKYVNNIGNRTSLQKAIKDVDKEYIKQTWKFALAVDALNVKRVENEEEMEERIQQLFDLCSSTGNVPTYESIAVACGIPSRTFYDWKNDRNGSTPEYSRIIKRAKEVVALMEASMVRDGKIPPSLWIFRSKNYLGMKDVQQIEAVQTASGDIPNQEEDLLAALPESPNEKVIELPKEDIKNVVDI